MKNVSVTLLSLFFGVAVALLALFLMLLPFNEASRFSAIFLLSVPLILFIVLFFLSRSVLNLFVKEKIYPIYRSVHRKSTSALRKKRLLGRNLISEVEDEVIEWAESNKNEVEKLRGDENYRKEFLGNVYHELKTPIFNMQGYILTLLEGGLEDESINRVYLERTEKNINRMISIVEDLESISGLESGALNLKIEKFSIRKLLEDVLEANELRAAKQKIKLEINRIKESDATVSGDKKRVYQVLNNLIINSINYGNSGGKTEISVLSIGENVLVEVKDNGIGISKTDIPRVFERFYRVDKSRSRDSGGTGLGLAIAKHIIEAHKQTISVSSSHGKGTTFSITLKKG